MPGGPITWSELTDMIEGEINAPLMILCNSLASGEFDGAAMAEFQDAIAYSTADAIIEAVRRGVVIDNDEGYLPSP